MKIEVNTFKLIKDTFCTIILTFTAVSQILSTHDVESIVFCYSPLECR